MEDLWKDTTTFVTGGTGGVGFQIACGVVAGGGDVVLGVRNLDRGRDASKKLRQLGAGSVELMEMDLARLETVASLTSDFPGVDFLVLNAGMIDLGSRERHVSSDGFELHLQTNYLGHFLLVQRLLPQLRAHQARVVIQSSLAARLGHIYWDNLQLLHHYSPWRAYAQSKLALTLWGSDLSRQGILVKICDPGVVPATGVAPRLRRFLPDGFAAQVGRLFANSPEEGAEPALMAMSLPGSGLQFCSPAGVMGVRGPARVVPAPAKLVNASEASRLVDVTQNLLTNWLG